MAGRFGVVATAGLLGILIAARAPAPARLLIALPAAGAASGFLQARLRFCVAFGSRGVYNFGPLGITEHVADREARLKDLRQSARIGAASAAVGIAAGVAAAVLPLR